MISSAVIIPEQNSPPRSPSPSLKRRQSSFTSETNKKPRLETRDSSDSNLQHAFPPSPKSTMSPPRRRSAIGTGAAEERKRGQRLFGALLGNLSQTGTKPAHRKRDEIAQRQRERVKKEIGEREEELRRKRVELDKVRRAEQKDWDEESMRVRHRNMRATAHSLRTKSEPRLYYQPWDLRPEEKDLIEQQVKEVERIIREEIGERGEGGQGDGASEPNLGDGNVSLSPKTNGKPDVIMTETDPPASSARQEAQEADQEAQNDQPDINIGDTSLTAQPEKAKEDDHGADELVEGQEDDVIY